MIRSDRATWPGWDGRRGPQRWLMFGTFTTRGRDLRLSAHVLGGSPPDTLLIDAPVEYLSGTAVFRTIRNSVVRRSHNQFPRSLRPSVVGSTCGWWGGDGAARSEGH